ncbi:hypothetical protein EJ03DRAFT_338606 [Teratosphaeria nubilosa]|uniref:beta-glucosidase n=1 Tax=Teratosphaeria nubilosa TaxID=161662 RepID=A0A6G1L1B8_9PEZI|nr:hypothetical protein EJ03DRAFT_338606 [Teratosphaeria nubilosa]
MSLMNPTEKENVTYGFAGASCSGQTGSIACLGVPGFYFQDIVNAYAAGINVAASWNVELALSRGSFMGPEFKKKGNNAINGPVAGPIQGRLAEHRRLQESAVAIVKYYIFFQDAVLLVLCAYTSVSMLCQTRMDSGRTIFRHVKNGSLTQALFDDMLARVLTSWYKVISGPNAAFLSRKLIQRRARQDNTYLYWDIQNQGPTVNTLSNACIVFLNQISSEGVEEIPASDALVTNVANKCNNTIVVINDPAIRTVDAWAGHPNVTALIYAHYPGNDAGESSASILHGEVSPSGRLPYTVAKNQSGYGSLLGPVLTNGTDPQADFTEGISTDYCCFLNNSIEPRYAFGISTSELPAYPPNITVAPRGVVRLWECLAHAYVDINGTGSVAAAEVPQLRSSSTTWTWRRLQDSKTFAEMLGLYPGGTACKW